MYYLYILYSAEADKYYVGHSEYPWNRQQQHLTNNGTKYTGSYKDWEMVAILQVSENRGDAVRLEKFIKKQKSRNLILKLIDPNVPLTGTLAQLVRVPHVRD
jgi:putative endonuclease